MRPTFIATARTGCSAVVVSSGDMSDYDIDGEITGPFTSDVGPFVRIVPVGGLTILSLDFTPAQVAELAKTLLSRATTLINESSEDIVDFDTGQAIMASLEALRAI